MYVAKTASMMFVQGLAKRYSNHFRSGNYIYLENR